MGGNRKQSCQILLLQTCEPSVDVCGLTIWIQTALKLQGQLISVVAADPGLISSWNYLPKEPKLETNHISVYFIKSVRKHHFCWLLSLPAAKMKCPSLDTLMEVHTVGISKSWMSSILRWISEFKNKSGRVDKCICVTICVNICIFTVNTIHTYSTFTVSTIFQTHQHRSFAAAFSSDLTATELNRGR